MWPFRAIGYRTRGLHHRDFCAKPLQQAAAQAAGEAVTKLHYGDLAQERVRHRFWLRDALKNRELCRERAQLGRA
jgi:hypothetical protein